MLSLGHRRRHSALPWMIVMIIAATSVPRALTQGRNPFEGTWKANLTKSQRDPNHQFQSATLRVEVSGETVSLIYSGVNMSGHEEKGTTKFLADGKEYPVVGVPGVVQVSKWLSSNVLETVATKDGLIVSDMANSNRQR